MAKRAKPRWGWLGVVCIRGAGQTDDQLVERGIVPGGRGDRGCVLSDAQFARLAAHLNITELPLMAKVRARLDFIRKFYLTSRLYEAESPTQAERNAALAIVRKHIGAFRAAVDALGPIPDWSLSDGSPIENPSPFDMFMTFPERLGVLAEIASENVTPAQRRDEDQAALLLSLSHCAMVLACALSRLDDASQNDVMNRLPWTADYDMDCFAAVARLTQRLGDAVGEALAAGRRRGGPRPFRELPQAIAWLRKVYERCGGQFTHTPRLKTHYDGTPHSAAGRFVADFFEMCDQKLLAHSISSAMAEVISVSQPPCRAPNMQRRRRSAAGGWPDASPRRSSSSPRSRA
jgi:hypothetical protein